MRVLVLDSNVIVYRDWWLSSGPAQALLATAGERAAGFKIIIPELVVREVANKHREEEVKTLRALEQGQRSVENLRRPVPPAPRATDEERPDAEPPDAERLDTGRFDFWFRERLREVKAEIAPLPDVPHEEVANAPCSACLRSTPTASEATATP